ncbi:hypothetical protein E2562_022829 [Oryza meyeriana var. granulata]|uniref:Uncharacterized protein n=1 Tax=Oryza meyeriana var. granulata TaxID=110450 RepID=A0A6G1FBE0_9ORYZ|nr:hypothetical protein E2562_022829 [Oryza meyeriana var. granulata]
MTGPEAPAELGEGGVCNPSVKKKKTTSMPEGCPLRARHGALLDRGQAQGGRNHKGPRGPEFPRARLEEGCQKLEALVRVTKAVYDRDVAKVEREHTALEVERVKAVAAREQAVKVAEALQNQREAFAILEAWANTCIRQTEEHKSGLTHHEEIVAVGGGCHASLGGSPRN